MGSTVSQGEWSVDLKAVSVCPWSLVGGSPAVWVEMPSTVRIQVGEGLENLGVLHVGGGRRVET